MRLPLPGTAADRFSAGVTALYALLTAVSLGRILTGGIPPDSRSDTCSYLVSADQPWSEPTFYSGIHPPTVPGIWSFFSNGHDQVGIILFQTLFQSVAWVYLAYTLSGLFRNRRLAAACHCLLLVYSLGAGVTGYASQLMSESLSLSLMLLAVGALIRLGCCPSWPRMGVAGAFAFLLAFSRDTNAYFLLAAACALAGREVLRAATLPGRYRLPLPASRLPVLALAGWFALCFAATTRNADRVAALDRPYCYGEDHPLVVRGLFDDLESRYLYSLLNLFAQRILPYDFRLRHFEERGLPVNDAVRAKAFHWASQGTDSLGQGAANWDWYWKDSLQAAKNWLAREGKHAYMEYLLLHPRYTFLRPWGELRPIYAGDSPFRTGFAFAFLGGLGPPFHFVFGPGKPLLVLGAAGLALALRLRRSGADGGDRALVLLLAGLLLLAVLFALFIYHADTMDLVRHCFAHGVTVDVLLLVSVLLLLDRLRRLPAPSDPSAP